MSTTTAAMQAVCITHFGGPEVLEIHEVARPEAVADQVLVRVHASALNRADLLQRQGKYPPPAGAPQDIPGIEFAGEIVATGPLVQLWKPGQRVFGLLGGGAHAEYIVTHERLLAEIPANLSFAEAAAIPEAFITAHDALWKQAELRPCEKVLIHAVASGVGLAAVQLCSAINAIPFGTTRTPEKLSDAKRFGLEAGLAVGDDFDPLVSQAMLWTAQKGFDVLLDLVGGPYVKASQKVMAEHGRMVLVGTVAGGKYELESRYVMGRRLQIRGTVLRSRALEEKIEATQAFAREVVPLFARGTLQPVIDSRFPLREIARAHHRLESNRTVGKIVLEI